MRREEREQFEEIREVAALLRRQMNHAATPRFRPRLPAVTWFEPQVDEKCLFSSCHDTTIAAARSRDVPVTGASSARNEK